MKQTTTVRFSAKRCFDCKHWTFKHQDASGCSWGWCTEYEAETLASSGSECIWFERKEDVRNG